MHLPTTDFTGVLHYPRMALYLSNRTSTLDVSPHLRDKHPKPDQTLPYQSCIHRQRTSRVFHISYEQPCICPASYIYILQLHPLWRTTCPLSPSNKTAGAPPRQVSTVGTHVLRVAQYQSSPLSSRQSAYINSICIFWGGCVCWIAC